MTNPPTAKAKVLKVHPKAFCVAPLACEDQYVVNLSPSSHQPWFFGRTAHQAWKAAATNLKKGTK
jgi:hypothetical protein